MDTLSDLPENSIALLIGSDAPRGSLLALRFHGKVELLYTFFGAYEACMLVVPFVATTLDAPFLPFLGMLPLLPCSLSIK